MPLAGIAARWGDLAVDAICKRYASMGRFVVPTHAIETGGAPMLIGLINRHVLPDLLASDPAGPWWDEIKYKDHCQKFQKQTLWEHGIDLPNWSDYLEVQQKTGIRGQLSIVQYRPGQHAEPNPVLLWQTFDELKKHVMIIERPHATFNRGAAYWNVDAFKCSPITFVAPPDLPRLSTSTNPWDRISKTGNAPQMQIRFCNKSPFERCACHCGSAGLFGYKDQHKKMVWYCEEHRLGRFWADARKTAR